MQLVRLATALFVAAISTTSVIAADIDVVGSWTSTAVPDSGDGVVAVGVHSTPEVANETTPDVSVVGSHTLADDNGDGGVSVVGGWSRPASDDYSTHTYCYENVVTNGVTSTVGVTATVENGVSPYGVNCQIVYRAGGGIVTKPLPQAAAPSHNKNLRIILPIVFSIVGLIVLIAGILVFLRLRARRNAKNNREWVNRKGGWRNGSLDRVQSVETAEVARV